MGRTIRCLLATFGIFWLSIWLALSLQWASTVLVDINAIVTEQTLGSAIAKGILMSLPRIISATLAGLLIVVFVSNQRFSVWIGITALLYLLDAPVRHHWGYPANWWDKTWQVLDLAFPALACIVAAFFLSRVFVSKFHLPSADTD